MDAIEKILRAMGPIFQKATPTVRMVQWAMPSTVDYNQPPIHWRSALDDAWSYDTNVYNGIDDVKDIIAAQPFEHAMAKGLHERPDHLMAWWLVHSGNLDHARSNWAGCTPSQITLALIGWKFTLHQASSGPGGKAPPSKAPIIERLTRHTMLRKLAKADKEVQTQANIAQGIHVPSQRYAVSPMHRHIEKWTPLFRRLDTQDFVALSRLFVNNLYVPDGATWAFIARAQKEDASTLDDVLAATTDGWRGNAYDVLAPPADIANTPWKEPLAGWALLTNTIPWDATQLLKERVVVDAIHAAKGLGLPIEDHGFSVASRATAYAIVANAKLMPKHDAMVDAGLFLDDATP